MSALHKTYQEYHVKGGYLHKNGKKCYKVILPNGSEYLKVGVDKFARLGHYNPDYHNRWLKTKIGGYRIAVIRRKKDKKSIWGNR